GDKITLALGEEATCTITNNDIAPKLHLRKLIAGGPATVADFPLSANAVKSGNDLNRTSPLLKLSTLQSANSTLSATADVNRYASIAMPCTHSTPLVPYTTLFRSGDKITLALGEEATCTITNNDIAPKLHLRKLIAGGPATVADFPLSANAVKSGNDLSGTSPVDSLATLQSDTWTLSETAGVSGYAASAWVCTDGAPGGSTPAAGQNGDKITLALGEEATCTITNNDIAPKLHLVKVVKNDNGGTAKATDFTLAATGNKTGNNVSGAGGADSGPTLQADTWTLT